MLKTFTRQQEFEEPAPFRRDMQRIQKPNSARLYIICANMRSHSNSSSHQDTVPRGTVDSTSAPSGKISRRAFASDAVAIAAISVMSPSLVALPHQNGSEVIPHQAPAENKLNLTPEQLQEVEARLANIIRKYGDRLSDEQRQHLRRILSYNETMLVPVRAFPLKNSDTPATILKLSTGTAPGRSHSSKVKSEGGAR